MTLLQRIKRACCRIETGRAVGTGYLVGPRQIATCAHVVKGIAKGGQVNVRFGDSSAPAVVATLNESDEASDCAYLSLTEMPAGAEPLALAPEPARPDWIAYGFPAFAKPFGVTLTGLIVDHDAEIPGRLRGLALFSQMLGSQPPPSVGGFSGSPIVVGEQVVGHMSSVLGIEGAMKQPHLGYAYAVPARSMLSLIGLPAAQAAEHTAPAASQETIIQQSTLLNALLFAASGKEVSDILEKAGALARGALFRIYAAQVLIGLMLPNDALKQLEGLTEVRAVELRALALSLTGQNAEAQALTRSLEFSAESRGIEGGILKRRWLATRNTSFLRAAFQTYFEAYDKLRDHYPGINAAACALYLGNPAESRKIATEIAEALAQRNQRDPWQEASLAEAYLLSGKLDEARAQYQVATLALAGRARDSSVLSAQARRNLKFLGHPLDALAGALPQADGVVAFTGHRVGAELPESRMAVVRERLSDALNEHQAKFGFCSAAFGSDLLFIELMLERGAELEVFLPFPPEHFINTSVGKDKAWLARFRNALDRVGRDHVTVLSAQPPASDAPQPFIECNDRLQEAARQKASALHTSALLLAVVSADSEGEQPSPGGAAHAVQAWLARGERDVIKIDPGAA